MYTNKQTIILDIGSNIGLSAIFWLTRSKDTFVHYEPSSENYIKLKNNLKDFDGRFSIFKKAVSSKTFSSFLMKKVVFIIHHNSIKVKII